MSANGHYLVFRSEASNLVGGDGTAGFQGSDIFRRDVRTGQTVRVSRDTAGGDPNGPSFSPSVSSNGRYVAFTSAASDLGGGDAGASYDVFVRDMQTGTTRLVSRGTGAYQHPDFDFIQPSISADGTAVAFIAVRPVGGPSEVFLRHIDAATTEQISVHHGSGEGTTSSQLPRVSGDGRYVVFTSGADDLVDHDTNDQDDTFVRDTSTQTTIRVSVSNTGGEGDIGSGAGVISSDGRYVAFDSGATNLLPGAAGPNETYVRDLATGVLSRVSVDRHGGPSDGFNFVSGITSGGRFVTWWGSSTDLVAGDTNGEYDVFVRDRKLNETVRVDLDSKGAQTTAGSSLQGALTANGRFVAFSSYDSGLVPGDGGTAEDVFVRAVRSPRITSATPGARAGRTTTVTLVGRGFAPNVKVKPTAGPGVTIDSVTYLSDTSLRLAVTVAPNAPLGHRGLAATVPGLGPGVVPASTGGCSGCLAVTA